MDGVVDLVPRFLSSVMVRAAICPYGASRNTAFTTSPCQLAIMSLIFVNEWVRPGRLSFREWRGNKLQLGITSP